MSVIITETEAVSVKAEKAEKVAKTEKKDSKKK